MKLARLCRTRHKCPHVIKTLSAMDMHRENTNKGEGEPGYKATNQHYKIIMYLCTYVSMYVSMQRYIDHYQDAGIN